MSTTATPTWELEQSTRTTVSLRALGLMYATTVVTSAFLLFQVQPLISRVILPWFGGTPAVWTTCMLFFQVVLFAGYAYAHLTATRLRLTMQAILHVGPQLSG